MDAQQIRRYVLQDGAKKPHALLDYLHKTYDLPNDSALARAIKTSNPVISRIRNGYRLGATVILKIHEHLGVPVAEIRKLAGEVEE